MSRETRGALGDVRRLVTSLEFMLIRTRLIIVRFTRSVILQIRVIYPGFPEFALGYTGEWIIYPSYFPDGRSHSPRLYARLYQLFQINMVVSTCTSNHFECILVNVFSTLLFKYYFQQRTMSLAPQDPSSGRSSPAQ